MLDGCLLLRTGLKHNRPEVYLQEHRLLPAAPVSSSGQTRQAGVFVTLPFACYCTGVGPKAWVQSLALACCCTGVGPKVATCMVLHRCGPKGVGPKVAACVCLFSLDKHGAVPVDTHVWQPRASACAGASSSILVWRLEDLNRQYIFTWQKIKAIAQRWQPSLRGKTLTQKMHGEIQDAFIQKYGEYAGWKCRLDDGPTCLYLNGKHRSEIGSQHSTSDDGTNFLLVSFISCLNSAQPLELPRALTKGCM
eukprot:1159898-Pelagomonas_calceolata.AAC.3